MYVRNGLSGLGSVGVPAMIQLPVPASYGGGNPDAPGSDLNTKKLSQNGLQNFQYLMSTGLNMPNAIEEAYQIQTWCDEWTLPQHPNPLNGGQGANWQCPFDASGNPVGTMPVVDPAAQAAAAQAAAAQAAQDAAARAAAAAAAYVPPPVARPQTQSYTGPIGVSVHTDPVPLPVPQSYPQLTPQQIQAQQTAAQQSAATANAPGIGTSSAASTSSSSSSMLDGITSWISANPLLAGAVALGALFLVGGGMGGRR